MISTSLRSIFLKSNRFDEIDEIRLLFFNGRGWPGSLEKPDAPVAPRPSRNGSGFATGNVDAGERRIFGFERSDLRRHGVCIYGRKTHLSAPPVDVVSIAASIAGERHNGDVNFTAVFCRRAEAGVAHRRWRNFRPAFWCSPFNRR